MALVVEDGTGVEGANSYLTVAELRAFAGDRGLTLPTDSEVEKLLVKATDYLELKSYIGDRASDNQGLSWPRTQTANPYWQYDDLIPTKLKTAQSLLAVEVMNGELSQATRPNEYIQTKIDVLYIKYAKDDDRSAGLRYRAVDDLLASLVTTTRPFQTVRA